MYNHNPQPDTDHPITIWRGIDTIKIGIGNQWNVEPHDMLKALQENVRENPNNYQYDLGGKIWAILPYGRKKYKYGLQHGQLSLFFSEEEYSPETPNVMAEAYPQAIAGQTLNSLQNEINIALAELNGDPIWTKISELHITTDTHVPEPLSIHDIYDHNYQPKWITRARKVQAITDHQQDVERLINRGATLQSLRYGGSILHVRIYNKKDELKAHPEKNWEITLWNNPYAQHVTRVEFQIRREKLKCFGVNASHKLTGQIPGIWKYLTEEWFTLNEHRGKWGNRDAIPSEFWNTVNTAWQTATPNKPSPRPTQNAAQRLAQAYGNLLSAAAILDMHQEEEITTLYQEWKKNHPEDWTQQVATRQEKIRTLQGKLRIRDQAAELEFDEQNAQRLPPYPEKETQQTLDFAENAQLAGGMLLAIPPDGEAAAARTASADR